jgi:hypothetical protein
MMGAKQSVVKTLGLFEKRIQGDDCLMELARLRFSQAGMGAEMHAATPEQLDWSLGFRPGKDAPVVVHLPRDFDLVEEKSQKRMVEFATRFAGQVHGFVMHDHVLMASRSEDYVAAAWKIEDLLEKISRCPILFVEYAAGLEPAHFAQFFADIRDLDRISACIDIGHVGIRAARACYAKMHRGDDVCALKSQGPSLPQVMSDVDHAVAEGAATVFGLVETISKLNKPVHFHLHDGHPLSRFSPFGVADHLSFDAEIPLNFEHRGRRSIGTMFGAVGLEKLVRKTLELNEPSMVSLTLEIHPGDGRLGLGDASSLFEHWADKTNAEQMNLWLMELKRNHELLRQAVADALSKETVDPLDSSEEPH